MHIKMLKSNGRLMNIPMYTALCLRFDTDFSLILIKVLFTAKEKHNFILHSGFHLKYRRPGALPAH